MKKEFQKKINGFTLIELLSVIILIAIVALITTPVVLNSIQMAKDGAIMESARGVVKSAEFYCSSEILNGNTITSLNDLALIDYSGMNPDSINLILDDSCNATGTVVIDGTSCNISLSGEIVVYTPEEYFTFSAGIITGYLNTGPKKVVIPPTIGGENVIGIGNDAFNNKDISSVILFEGIQTIGRRAFSSNSRLTEIIVPDSVITIDRNAFGSLPNLEKIHLGANLNNIQGYLTPISITTPPNWDSYVIPESSILDDLNAWGAGSGSGTLPYILSPGTNPDIITMSDDNPYMKASGNNIYTKNGDWLIYGFNGDTIEPGTIAISSTSFLNKGITSVTIPNSVKFIGGSAFNGNNLTNLVIPNSVEIISGQAFANNPNLISVNIGNGIRSVGVSAFSGLANIIINIDKAQSNVAYYYGYTRSFERGTLNFSVPNTISKVTYGGDWALGTCSPNSVGVNQGSPSPSPSCNRDGYVVANYYIRYGSCAGVFNTSTGICSNVANNLHIISRWSN